MANRKPKLELTWIGKEHRPRLEPRILLEQEEYSYHAAHKFSDQDIFDNRLIHGDNLLALKALEQEFAGKVKCVYIDPPFNTKQAFEHYDDGVEHSLWLQLMRDRVELLHSLLSEDGSIFLHIDDNELAYLMALTDEVFGRKNRISVITFKQSSVSGPKAVNPGIVTTASFILYYCKNKEFWKPNRTFMRTERDDRYNKVIANYHEPYKTWTLLPLKEAFGVANGGSWDHARARFAEKTESKLEEFVLANAHRVVRTARVAPKDVNEDAREALEHSIAKPGEVFRSEREGKTDYYFLNGEQLLFYSTKTRLVDGVVTTAIPASNIWDDLLSNNLHKEGGVNFPNGKKPEFLIKRVLDIATNPGDLVLDSFLGSGTTAAVAHKMGRRWIGIEVKEQGTTHCLPRVKKVVDGTDLSGITRAVGWKGGGGFRFYRLAPSLLAKDKWGNWVISADFNGAMLAEAACKLEGFIYAPSDAIYWQHGRSSERDFIYITTQNLSAGQLSQLSEEVGSERTLLVLCASFRAETKQMNERYPNLTVKKIPKQLLARCEWGQDDYSLRVENLPKAPPKLGQQSLFGEEVGR